MRTMSSSSAILGSSTVEARQIPAHGIRMSAGPSRCDNPNNRILHLLTLADIGCRRRTTRPILPKLAGERLEPRRVTIDQADARTALRKQPAELEPDAAGRSADDDDLFRGSHIVSLFPSAVATCSYHTIGSRSRSTKIDHLNRRKYSLSHHASGTVPTLTLQ